MTLEEIKKTFGLNPTEIGKRYRSHFVLESDDSYEHIAKKGYLSVCARDGARNEPDCTVGRFPNYVGTFEDAFDFTYRHYIFRPITDEV